MPDHEICFFCVHWDALKRLCMKKGFSRGPDETCGDWRLDKCKSHMLCNREGDSVDQKASSSPNSKGLDTAEIVQMYQNGMSPTEIAEKLGCTDGAVHYHLNKAGLRGKPKRKKATGKKGVRMIPVDATCETCAHRHVCRYIEEAQKTNWALCRYWEESA